MRLMLRNEHQRETKEDTPLWFSHFLLTVRLMKRGFGLLRGACMEASGSNWRE